MAKVTIDRAFDLWPEYELRLGEKVFGIPPLTLGRFLNLTGPAVMECTEVVQLGLLGILEKMTTDAGRTPEDVLAGRLLASLDPKSLFPIASAIIPRLDEAAWTAFGGILELEAVGRFLYELHDWEFIGQELGVTEEHEVPTGATVNAALTGFAQATGRTVEDLLEMRLEGFYHYARGIRELRAQLELAAKGPLSTPEELGVPIVKDAGSPLWDAMEKAENGNG